MAKKQQGQPPLSEFADCISAPRESEAAATPPAQTASREKGVKGFGPIRFRASEGLNLWPRLRAWLEGGWGSGLPVCRTSDPHFPHPQEYAHD